MSKGKILPFKGAGLSPYNAEAEREQNVIGLRIAEARKKSGMSLVAFSRYLKSYGVSVGDGGLNKWETGATIPNAYQLMAVCTALGIEDGFRYFMDSYQPLLNDVGLKKIADYKSDLIATGKYKPEKNLRL